MNDVPAIPAPAAGESQIAVAHSKAQSFTAGISERVCIRIATLSSLNRLSDALIPANEGKTFFNTSLFGLLEAANGIWATKGLMT